jgi:hypothetical protein
MQFFDKSSQTHLECERRHAAHACFVRGAGTSPWPGLPRCDDRPRRAAHHRCHVRVERHEVAQWWLTGGRERGCSG